MSTSIPLSVMPADGPAALAPGNSFFPPPHHSARRPPGPLEAHVCHCRPPPGTARTSVRLLHPSPVHGCRCSWKPKSYIQVSEPPGSQCSFPHTGSHARTDRSARNRDTDSPAPPAKGNPALIHIARSIFPAPCAPPPRPAHTSGPLLPPPAAAMS